MDSEQLLIDHVCSRLATIPGVLAIALGGSRATGEYRPNSDFDFAIYYRENFDPNDIGKLGWLGSVSEIGGWGGGVMNGGAWLNVDEHRVDVHYRDLDQVEHHLSEAQGGRFKVERLPFYLAGIPTYVVVGELALAKVLVGSLPKPDYPTLLREKAYEFWHESALLSLNYAQEAYATQGAVIGAAGSLARAVIEESHARLAARGEWVLNEKRIIRRAGLTHLASRFTTLSLDIAELTFVIRSIREEILASENC